MIIHLPIPVSGFENLQSCQRKINTVYPSSPTIEEIAGLIIAYISDEDYETPVLHELLGLEEIPEETQPVDVRIQDEAGIRVNQHFQAMAETLSLVQDRPVTAAQCMAAAIALLSPAQFFELYDSVMLSTLQE